MAKKQKSAKDKNNKFVFNRDLKKQYAFLLPFWTLTFTMRTWARLLGQFKKSMEESLIRLAKAILTSHPQDHAQRQHGETFKPQGMETEKCGILGPIINLPKSSDT